MPSFRRLLPIALSLAAATTAATCPQNWLQDTAVNGGSKCCYGNMIIDGRNAYCCVYDMTPKVITTIVSTSSTFEPSFITTPDCFAKVPFTASDYSDQVSSASSKVAAAATTIATNEAISTSASSTTSSGSAATTTNAAMPIATAHEMVLGGAAVAIGLFML
ncbi:hypothetical protein N7510_011401 [Penicillium lagena]|uniref:uncharacterized protein n=1 Tax=Penicillium lagena TaxID=94218 RepID=UPI0025416205|nr:uncharacterized protein N7510_011401 [Penicillium lagena]KAJ5601867.1 hypothetical protein N7510_011401 [Penicillium lagena]